MNGRLPLNSRSVFGTVEHDVHRKRRGAISAFFSKRAVNDIEPWIHDKTEQLCANMRQQQKRDGSVELRSNFLAMTTDMIAAHALNGSNPQKTLNLLQDERKALEWQKTIAAVALLTPICKQIPWLIPMALKLPVGFWMSIAPPLGRIVRLNRVSGLSRRSERGCAWILNATTRQDMRREAQAAIDEASMSLTVDEEKTEKSVLPTTKRHNIFRTILQSSLPSQEKEQMRLGQEGFVAIAAGGETCGRMMSTAVYYVMAHKTQVMPRLSQELLEVMPTRDAQPDLKDLEQLPYLVSIPLY